MMKPLEESIAMSLDCCSLELIPHLPYILQDFHELGSHAKSLLSIINNLKPYRRIDVLDLGCGKGAVTCYIAENVDSTCLGIDAMPEFIEYANNYSKERGISNCSFIVDDIRDLSAVENKYDFIIIGSVGPVFKNYTIAMESFKNILKEDGFILLDDAYMEKGRTHHIILSKEELFTQILNSGMIIVNEVKGKDVCIEDEFATQLDNIKQRCNQLINRYPENENIFRQFIKKQENEYGSLKSQITCSTLVIRQKPIQSN